MFISSLVNDIVKVNNQNYAGMCKRFQLIYIVVVTFPLCLYVDHFCTAVFEGRGGLMVSALDSGSSPGRGHCVVFLGKKLNSHSASLHPGV